MQILTNRIMSLLRFVAFIVCCLSIILCCVMAIKINSDYSLLVTWPILLFFFLFINYSKASRIKESHYLVLSLIVFTQLIPRYAVFPTLVLLSSRTFIGIRHIVLSSSDIKHGIVIVAFELFCFTFFLWGFERLKGNSIIYKNRLRVYGNKYVYFAYFLFSLVIYFAIGRNLHVVQFIRINNDYSGIEENLLFTLVKYIISIALTLFVILVFAREKKRYDLRKRNIHFIISLLFGVLLTLVIIGESRGTQITIGLLVILMLINDYPNKKVPIIVTIAVAVIVIVVAITIFRTDSVKTILGSSIVYLARQLQVYSGGPDSVIQNILVLENQGITILNLVFDFVRSCFPFNLILKNYGYTVSQIYNQILYNGMSLNGHIVFGASYGYLFFGIIGIPLTMCLNYYLASKACDVFNRTDSYEVKYVAGYCMLKLVNVFCENTPAILGSVTQYIGTFGLLILVSNLLF